MIRAFFDAAAHMVRRLRSPGSGGSAIPTLPGERGAVTVEYALTMLIAAAILAGVETEIFQPMAKDILKDFMEFIVKPDP
jgi:Flp pilus assembly pilin Flp